MLVGISGHSRAGKDLTAKILQQINPAFHKRSFADPLRSVLLEVIETIDPILSDAIKERGWDALKASHPEVVSAMIALGAGMRHHVNHDVWVPGPFVGDHEHLVIPDVRHVNEAEEVRKRGGFLWKITRPGTVPKAMDSLLDDWTDWDVIIENSGTLPQLEEKVRRAWASTAI